MSELDRAALYRKRALEAESKAFLASTEEMRRSWLILARDWTKMAEGAEATTSIVPSQEIAQPSLDEMISSALAAQSFSNIAK